MMAVTARILARYISGGLVLYGWVDPGTAAAVSGDLAVVLGAALAALAEGSYALARRYGWAT